MIYADLHTHTVYSHGKGTIEENYNAALRCGLTQLGISDHGLGHIMFNVKKKEIAVMRQEIERINAMGKPTELYLGIEANITDTEGGVDLTYSQAALFDYVIVGYHKAVKPISFSQMFKFNLNAIVKSAFKNRPVDKTFTRAFVKAIESGKVDIISHLNLDVRVDVTEVGKAARDYGVLIELNGKGVALTDDEIDKLVHTGVMFIVNSDAHSPERVGEISKPMVVVERMRIPHERIVNMCGPLDIRAMRNRKRTDIRTI